MANEEFSAEDIGAPQLGTTLDLPIKNARTNEAGGDVTAVSITDRNNQEDSWHPLGKARHQQIFAEHMSKISKQPLTPESTKMFAAQWDQMDVYDKRLFNKKSAQVQTEIAQKRAERATSDLTGFGGRVSEAAAPEMDVKSRKTINDRQAKRKERTLDKLGVVSGLTQTENGTKLFRRGNVGEVNIDGFPDINFPDQREAMGKPRTTEEHDYQVPFKHMISTKQGIDNDPVFHEHLAGIIHDLTNRPLKGQTSLPLSNTHLPDRFIGDTFHFVSGETANGTSERNRLSQEASYALSRSAAAHANNMVPEAYQHYSDAVSATNKLAHHVRGLDTNRGAEAPAGPPAEVLKTGNLLAGYADRINLDGWQRLRRAGRPKA